MRRHIILLFALALFPCAEMWAQQSDLFMHRRINLYDMKTMPNKNGKTHKDSIFNNRIWRAEQPGCMSKFAAIIN